ncbi:MAG: sugar transferase [Clostridia bacterium]|nr:sugar transferase [Clostridia bacterium]
MDTVQPNPSPVYRLVKRAADILLSLLGLTVLFPLFVIVAACLAFEREGGVIFRQERAGWKNQPFVLYKFRTMVKNAAAMRAEMERYNEMDGPAFKMKNDPRVTKMGRFLRRTSLDELPQLWNVLKGDMSLVGPRPLPTYESEKCTEEQLQRLLVKPGITCYWQACGRNEVPFSEWMEMDMRYIREQSLWTDTKILLKTAKAVLSGRGAY